MKHALALAAGVFFGNWLMVPFISDRSFNESFEIGVIAAVSVFTVCAIAKAFTKYVLR